MNYNLEIQARKRLRIQGCSYKITGYYFVTICTNNRICLFGEILNNKMNLNPAGDIVQKSLNSIQNLYPRWFIDTHIVMPNHIHVLLFSDGSTISLPEVIRNFKSYTTIIYGKGVYNENWQAFDQHLWQRSYHEQIIRNDINLNKIRRYIIDNPAKWSEDQDNPYV